MISQKLHRNNETDIQNQSYTMIALTGEIISAIDYDLKGIRTEFTKEAKPGDYLHDLSIEEAYNSDGLPNKVQTLNISKYCQIESIFDNTSLKLVTSENCDPKNVITRNLVY